MLIRSFWKSIEINEQQRPSDGSVIVRRTRRGGLLTSDVVNWAVHNRNLDLNNAVAYVEVLKFRENDIDATPDVFNNLLFNNYQQIVIDNELSDEENSKTISDSLGLTNNGQPVCLLNYNITPNLRANVLSNNLIVNYTAWCILHNKLMIEPNNIFYNRIIYSCNTNEPANDDREYFIMYPGYMAIEWSRNWSIIVSRNNFLEIIKSFNKYSSAQKAANKYLRKITGNRRMPIHNFRIGEFCVNTQAGEIVVRAYKEKELV